MDFAYRIDDVAVVSDVIGGEAVILHRVSGDYFSTDGVGCQIWQWIGENRSRDWILKTLNERFAATRQRLKQPSIAFSVTFFPTSSCRKSMAALKRGKSRGRIAGSTPGHIRATGFACLFGYTQDDIAGSDSRSCARGLA